MFLLVLVVVAFLARKAIHTDPSPNPNLVPDSHPSPTSTLDIYTTHDITLTGPMSLSSFKSIASLQM